MQSEVDRAGVRRGDRRKKARLDQRSERKQGTCEHKDVREMRSESNSKHIIKGSPASGVKIILLFFILIPIASNPTHQADTP